MSITDSSHDGSGSVKFYCLKTKAVVIGDSWIKVQIPDTVIEHLNMTADPTRRRKASQDPTFNPQDNEYGEQFERLSCEW
jgi:hypothetical protein